jgi:hypothetical protein
LSLFAAKKPGPAGPKVEPKQGIIEQMKSKTVLSILAAIIILGFFLRVHGINYHSYGDEAIQVYYSLRLGLLKMLPVSFHRIALSIFYGVSYAIGWILGVFSSPREFVNLYFARQHVFYLAGRLFETLAATACIPVIYSAGKKLYDERTALVGALFLSVTPVYAAIAQKARGQGLASLLCLLALNWGIMIWKSRSRRYYLLAWIAAAAAASCTLYCVAVAVPLISYHLMGAWDAASGGTARGNRAGAFLRGAFSGKIVLGVFSGGAAYAAFSSGKLLEMGNYFRATLVNTGLLGGSRLYYFGSEVANGWRYYFSRGFPEAFGFPLLGVCLFGIVYSLVRPRWRTSGLLISAALLFFGVMGKGQIASSRYLFPLVPWLLLPGAHAWAETFRRLVRREPARAFALAAASLLIAVWPGLKIARDDALQIRPSTKNLAEEWIVKNLPPGTRIAVENMGYSGPDLKFTPVIDHWMNNLSDAELDALYRQRQEEGIDSFALKYFIDSPPAKKYYIRTISIKDEITPNDLLREGYQYVAINSLSWSAFRSRFNREKYPDFTAKRLALYDWMEREGELVQVFKPGAATAGSEIRIYRLSATSP